MLWQARNNIDAQHMTIDTNGEMVMKSKQQLKVEFGITPNPLRRLNPDYSGPANIYVGPAVEVISCSSSPSDRRTDYISLRPPLSAHLRLQPPLNHTGPLPYIWNVRDRGSTGTTFPSYYHLPGYWSDRDRYGVPSIRANLSTRTHGTTSADPGEEFKRLFPVTDFQTGVIFRDKSHKAHASSRK